jgi:hypothetical protein
VVTLVVRDRGTNPRRGAAAGSFRLLHPAPRRPGWLAIADRFVSSLGGRIDLVNLEGRGFEARIVCRSIPAMAR